MAIVMKIHLTIIVAFDALGDGRGTHRLTTLIYGVIIAGIWVWL